MKIPQGIITKPFVGLWGILFGKPSKEGKDKFLDFVKEVIEAGAEGAARGAAKSLRSKTL